ncbi:MAG: rhodanese-like domain-containing protein [Alphaproteobacteria bacterium]|nr:rhodanese-like domain-containing protein [Alphaproteobacteria bacterium]
MAYAGDISVQDSWRALREDASAVLIDVRTKAEWNFVGVPDLSTTGKSLVQLEWQTFPGGQPNPNFVSELKAKIGPGAKLYFLCRSGGRSRAAAEAMTGAGHAPCYNIAGGFEGDLNSQKHRGTHNGWKAAGLPWAQT